MVSQYGAVSNARRTSGDEAFPVGMSDGLPIGLMLIGKYYDESVIYRAGPRAFERRGRLDQDVKNGRGPAETAARAAP